MSLLTRRQMEVWPQVTRNPARWNVHVGAVQSGKTYLNYIVKAHRMRKLPPGRCMLIGKTQDSYARNVLDPMRDMFGEELVGRVSGRQTVRLFGRECQIFGANDERAINALMGFNAVYLDGDEFVLWPENFFRHAQTRLSRPGACADLTCNPASPRHWAKAWIDSAENLRYFEYRLDDNTFLDPAYVADVKASCKGVWYDRLVLGKWCIAEGAVYDMFDETRHVVAECPPCARYWVGVDYGAVAPTVFLLIGQAADDLYYVIDEWEWDSKAQHRQLTEDQLVKGMGDFLRRHAPEGQEFLQPEMILCDPSAAGLINALRVGGWYCGDTDNDVISGIRTVGSLFNTNRLFVHARCRRLLDEIAGYAWDMKAAERGEDAPIKKEDHAVDPLRYVMQTVGVASCGAQFLSFRRDPLPWEDDDPRADCQRMWHQW